MDPKLLEKYPHLTADQVDALMRTANEHKEALATQAKEGADAILTEKIKKITEDILKASAPASPAGKRSIVFGKAPATGAEEGKEYVSFQKFLAMVKERHPEIASQRFTRTKADTLITTDNALGGYTIGVEYERAIIGALNNVATWPGKMTQMDLGAPSVKTTNWLTNFVIRWAVENARKLGTNPTFGQLTRSMSVAYALIAISNQELNWNLINLEGVMEEKFGELLGVEIERLALVGSTTGGDPFNGVVNATGVLTSAQAAAGFARTDLVNILNKSTLIERFRIGAEWTFNRTVLGIILNLTDGEDRPIFDTERLLKEKAILGYPYNITDQMTASGTPATNKIIFGNPKNSSFVKPAGRGSIAIDISNSGILTDGAGVVTYNAMEQNGNLFRLEMECGTSCDNPLAYVVGTGVKESA